MARTGRPKAELVLTDDERETLARWARRRTSSQALALRCRIVLESATGATNKDVADRLGIEAHTVSRWRARFIRERLGGLTDEPRPGGPRKITDAQVEEVVVKTLEATPKDATHWSTRSMAREVGLSQSAISRIWRTFGLKPHLVDTFKLSKDPQFIEKVRDVVGLYLAPPEHALVLCVDEKTQIQALDRSAPVLPMMPGMPERRSHDYVRGGVTTLFAALNTATGEVLGKTAARHTSEQFVAFLAEIVASQPEQREIHVICDNVSSHKTALVEGFLAAHKQVRIHYTPTYSSWLNQVENWFSRIQRNVISRGIFTSVKDLDKKLMRYIRQYNKDPKPLKWKYDDPSRRHRRFF